MAGQKGKYGLRDPRLVSLAAQPGRADAGQIDKAMRQCVVCQYRSQTLEAKNVRIRRAANRHFKAGSTAASASGQTPIEMADAPGAACLGDASQATVFDICKRQGEPVVDAKTILVVEDNELNMKLFCDLLEAHGYQTLRSRTGKLALELAREHTPDLILMDIQLPEVSGLDVTRWIKDDPVLKSIPVIAVTAFAMKGDEERIKEGGCEGYLAKPISVERFIQTVRQFA